MLRRFLLHKQEKYGTIIFRIHHNYWKGHSMRITPEMIRPELRLMGGVRAVQCSLSSI